MPLALFVKARKKKRLFKNKYNSISILKQELISIVSLLHSSSREIPTFLCSISVEILQSVSMSETICCLWRICSFESIKFSFLLGVLDTSYLIHINIFWKKSRNWIAKKFCIYFKYIVWIIVFENFLW